MSHLSYPMNVTNGSPKLVVLMPVPAHEPNPTAVLLTKKAHEGARKLAEFWGGTVQYIAPPGGGTTGNLDDVYYERSELPYRVDVMPFDSPELVQHLRTASIVLGGPMYAANHVPHLCREYGVPYVHTAEYTPRTRRQIIRTETSNPLRRLRRYVWDARQEQANLDIVRLSAGVQCNGTPTYYAYRELAHETLLFFDSRVTADMVAVPDVIRARVRARKPGDPIRLAFSGRFVPMKGVDHLPLVAKHLANLGVPFEMHLCGGGGLERHLRKRVAQLGLEEHVRFHGVLDYERELVPFIRDHVDLFVACHRQGDPSCTYVETFACGVPVVGYDNEALAGLSAIVGATWTTRMDRPAELARKIAELAQTPAELERASITAASFARQNTFERTFARRVEQLVRLSRVKPSLTHSLAAQLESAVA